MRIAVTILLIGAVALTVVVYVMFAHIVFAIWCPNRASRKWVEVANSSAILASRPFFKWIVPILLVLMPVWLAVQAIRITLE